jgi:hypothetical protein
MPGGARPRIGVDDIREFWWPTDGSRTRITAYTTTVDEIGGGPSLAYVRGTGEIHFTYENGPIGLEDLGGDVTARTENGPIGVVLSGTTWEGQGLDAETENGPISVSIPANYAAVLETGTVNGPFDTEIPLQVRIEPGDSTRRFRVDLGGGGPLVRVVTTNGPVSIKAR